MKIKAQINENGYLTGYAIIGDVENSIEIEVPDDFEEKNYRAYRVIGLMAVMEHERLNELAKEREAYQLRQRRETECFTIINRGGLWYDLLTGAEKSELLDWYQAWLDAPQTGVFPITPAWLK